MLTPRWPFLVECSLGCHTSQAILRRLLELDFPHTISPQIFNSPKLTHIILESIDSRSKAIKLKHERPNRCNPSHAGPIHDTNRHWREDIRIPQIQTSSKHSTYMVLQNRPTLLSQINMWNRPRHHPRSPWGAASPRRWKRKSRVQWKTSVLGLIRLGISHQKRVSYSPTDITIGYEKSVWLQLCPKGSGLSVKGVGWDSQMVGTTEVATDPRRRGSDLINSIYVLKYIEMTIISPNHSPLFAPLGR